MKINTNKILKNIKDKKENLKIRLADGKLSDITVGDVLIDEMNNSKISPKILWSVMPKIANGGNVEVSKEQLDAIKSMLESHMERPDRPYSLMVYGQILDELENIKEK